MFFRNPKPESWLIQRLCSAELRVFSECARNMAFTVVEKEQKMQNLVYKDSWLTKPSPAHEQVCVISSIQGFETISSVIFRQLPIRYRSQASFPQANNITMLHISYGEFEIMHFHRPASNHIYKYTDIHTYKYISKIIM